MLERIGQPFPNRDWARAKVQPRLLRERDPWESSVSASCNFSFEGLAAAGYSLACRCQEYIVRGIISLEASRLRVVPAQNRLGRTAD
jgi:hypothetical protein